MDGRPASLYTDWSEHPHSKRRSPRWNSCVRELYDQRTCCPAGRDRGRPGVPRDRNRAGTRKGSTPRLRCP